MAIPTSIKTLLSGDVVEWARIEFKETWDAAAFFFLFCVFANDIFGVKQSTNLVLIVRVTVYALFIFTYQELSPHCC